MLVPTVAMATTPAAAMRTERRSTLGLPVICANGGRFSEASVGDTDVETGRLTCVVTLTAGLVVFGGEVIITGVIGGGVTVAGARGRAGAGDDMLIGWDCWLGNVTRLACSNAVAKALTEAKRSSGCFAKAINITCSTSGESVERYSRREGGGMTLCLMAISV